MNKQRRRKNRKGVNVTRQGLARSKRNSSRRLHAERLEDRRLLTTVAGGGTNAYHNYIVPEDVNSDYYLSPRDALSVITELNTTGSRVLEEDGGASNPDKIDTNGDGVLSPYDALVVINALNNAEGAGEIKVVAMTLELQDANGTPIPSGSRIKSGDDFRLQIYVQDLRNGGSGLYSAYMDIGYSNDLVSTDYSTDPDTLTELFTLGGSDPSAFTDRLSFQGNWVRGNDYTGGGVYASPWRWFDTATSTFKSLDELDDPSMTPDEFDEMGSFLGSLNDPMFGNTPIPMMYGTLTADLRYDSPGTVTFEGNPADRVPGSDMLFYNPATQVILPEGIQFNSVSVEIFKPIYARDDSVTTAEDTAIAIPYLSNDELDTLSTGTLALQSFTQPVNGSVALVGGQLVYTPDDDYNNDSGTPDAFTYTMTDGLGNTDMATVSITVTAVNDPPNAVADSEVVDEDMGPYLFNVLGNDTPGPATAIDEIGQALSLTSVGAAGMTQQGGTVVIEGGQVKYTPAPDFFGNDSFTYVVSDSGGASSTGSVSVTVNNTNDAPTAVNDEFGVSPQIVEDLNGAAFVEFDVLANDQTGVDPVSEKAAFTLIGVGEKLNTTGDAIENAGTTAGGGAVTISGSVIRYTPAADFFGTDTFVYEMSDRNDGSGLPGFATVTVHVTSVNDAPIAQDVNLEAEEREAGDPPTEFAFSVFTDAATPGPANESPGDFVVFNGVVSNPTNGTLVVDNVNGVLVYTPNAGFEGTDEFTYAVRDSFGLVSNVATASILVEPLTLPRARDDRNVPNIVEDTPATIDVLVNDELNPGASLSQFVIVVDPLHGTAQVTMDNKVLYTPDADYFGPDSFVYQIDDDATDSIADTATVSFTVQAVNDAPVANDDDFTFNEDETQTFAVLGNDGKGAANESAQTILIEAIGTSPQHGQLTIVDGGTKFQYVPDANYFGTDSFTYSIRDDGGTPGLVSNQATVSLVIDNVNDAPTAVDGIFPNIQEDSTNNAIDVMLDDFVGMPNTNDGPDSIALQSLGTPSQGGTVTIDGNVVRYTPKANFFGTETFTYTIVDSGGLTDTGMATILVANVNDPPTVVDEVGQDRLMALKNFTDQEFDVLANDSIAPDEGEVLTLKELIGEDGVGNEVRGDTVTTKHGVASISADRLKVIYTPTTDFETVGSDYDLIGYVVQDGNGGETEGLAEVDVIDAVPSDISGSVYIDANGDGVQQPEELTLAGVEVTLTGTNIRGAAVNMTIETDANGVFTFPGILPTAENDTIGYSITAQTPKYLNDGLDTIVNALQDEDYNPGDAQNDLFSGIVLGVWGSNGRAAGNYAFGESGLASSYIKLTQYLASTRRGMMLATSADGDTYWFSIMEGWEGVTSASFEFSSIPAAGSTDNSGLATATLTVNGQTRSLSYYTDYDFAGDPRNGGCVVFLKGSAADLGFDLTSNDGSMDAEGEMSIESQELELLAAGNAASFRDGVDAVFGSDDWA